jgi:iron complex outermembrane recepter protein
MKKIFFLSAAFCYCLIAAAQSKITIRVVSNSLEPIGFALVKIQETNQSDFTSDNGYISFSNISNDEINVEISALGYQPKIEKLNLKERLTNTNFITIKLTVKYNLIQEVQIQASRVSEKSGVAFQNLNSKYIKSNNIGTDIPTLLNNQTSIVSTTDNGTGVGYSYMRIRGTDAQRTNVTINGIPFNDAESQGVYFVNMPDLLSSVGSIQIQRGVGSVSNGSAAFGASINMQTEGLNENPYAEVALGGGSYNFNKQTVKIGTGLINHKVSADLRLSHIGTDGYINNSKSNLSSYYGALGYYGKYTNIKFITFSGTEKTSLSYNGIPEAALKKNKTQLDAFYANNYFSYPTREDSINLFDADRRYNSILYENEDDNYKQSHYQLHYAFQKNKWHANVSGHYTKGAGYYEQYKFDQKFKKYGLPNAINPSDSSIIKSSDIIRQKHLDNDFIGAIASLRYQLNNQINFTLGGSYNTYSGLHFGKVLWSKSATQTANFPFEYYRNKANKTEAASYLKVNYQAIKHLNIGAEIQIRKVQHSMKGLADDQSTKDTSLNVNYTPFINPRLSVSYDITPALNAYAFYGRALKEPNRDDFKSAPAKSQPKVEELNNVECGLRYTSNFISANINYYYMLYKNQLVLTGLLNDVGDQYRTNVSNSYRQGLELELNSNINKFVSIGANATFSENKITNYTDVIPDFWTGDLISEKLSSTNISYSPNLIAGLNITSRPLKNLDVVFNAKHVGRQYLDNTGNINKSIKPYTTGDLRIAYSYSRQWLKQATIYFQVNNLWNTQYVSNGYTVNYYLDKTNDSKKYIDNYYLVQAPIHFIMGTTITF